MSRKSALTKLLDRAVPAARNLSPGEQDHIARVVRRLTGADEEPPVSPAPGEAAAIANSKAAAAGDEFAGDEEVRAVWAKHGLRGCAAQRPALSDRDAILGYIGPGRTAAAPAAGTRGRRAIGASSSPAMNAKAKLSLWLIVSFVLIGLALFLSAGTIRYWQAWLYIAVAAASNVPLTRHILQDPILLQNRTKAGPAAEQRPLQKAIVTCLAIPAIAAFIVPGLDYRFGWSRVPPWLFIIGNIVIIAAMWMVYRVFRENSYGSATVEVTQDQRVVSTGPYALVRNPMYSSAAVYFVGLALALGSYWGLIPAILMIAGLVWRLLDEEKFLARHLAGYTDYCAKVRWHLIPGVF